MSRRLNDSNAASRGISFEPFAAYLLALAFSVPTRLSDVFEFVGGSKASEALQKLFGQLVTLEKVGDKFKTTALNIKTNLRSSHALGCSASSVADTLEWLQNPQGSAFCFPANLVGPDLFFALRLTSDELSSDKLSSNETIIVSAQIKHTSALEAAASEQAIRTTEPSTFLSRRKKDTDSPTCSDPLMRDKIEEAIKNLGNGTRKAGPCGLLRVLISHPSPPDDNALEEAGKEGRHPLATVPLTCIYPPKTGLGQTLLAMANLALQRPDRKRKGSDEIQGVKPKRQRRG